ncbi:4Fe-4S binding protein [Pelomyxa schiedti]|nr:4Fe-4S binding protein [Pelomyxa schiedti]
MSGVAIATSNPTVQGSGERDEDKTPLLSAVNDGTGRYPVVNSGSGTDSQPKHYSQPIISSTAATAGTSVAVVLPAATATPPPSSLSPNPQGILAVSPSNRAAMLAASPPRSSTGSYIDFGMVGLEDDDFEWDENGKRTNSRTSSRTRRPPNPAMAGKRNPAGDVSARTPGGRGAAGGRGGGGKAEGNPPAKGGDSGGDGKGAAGCWAARKPPPPTALGLSWHKLVMFIAFLCTVYVAWTYINISWIAVYAGDYFVNRFFCIFGWSEVFVIALWGIWRSYVALTPQDSTRAMVIVSSTVLVYGLIPMAGITEPCLGYGRDGCVFPAAHEPASFSFFALWGLTLLFGRRVDCGYCCTCVGLRETAGYCYRHRTPRQRFLWLFVRHLKWLYLAWMFLFMFCLLPIHWVLDSFMYRFVNFVLDWFWAVVLIPYYSSLMLMPLLGNRNFCRWLCPFGALWGLSNKLGFYIIKADSSKCVHCRLCESVCDMGVPVEELVNKDGKITSPDCMGCGRCVAVCPKKVLKIEDVRDVARRAIDYVKRKQTNEAV